MKNDEFYIGWMGNAPQSFAGTIKKYLFVLLPVIVLLAVALALSQKKFGTGNFEFGTLTVVKGIYADKPIPNLKVIDGKLLMQIDPNDKPLLNIAENKNEDTLPKIIELGTMTVKGEIVDPKCFFGVMKPGEGKPHKDCAIRCILGGIPPVLKVADEEGRQNYYLIVGVNGEQMNEGVQDFVAAPAELLAKAVQYDDWLVLYVQPGGMKHYSFIREHYNSPIASCMPERLQ